MDKKVAIIIINYKDYAKRFLADCRDTLRAQDYPHDLTGVYVVDNASSKESRKYLGENFPEAKIIEREDGNYAAANNTGIRAAIKDGYEFFVIANMDVVFDRNWLRELVLALEVNNGAGIAQSKILLYKGNKSELKEKFINSLGNINHFLGFGFTDGYMEPDREIEGYPEIRGYASGCSFIIKREVYEKIGGYNEEYYMYHDDVELGWKVKLAGYKIILAPKSVLYHKYSFSRSVLMVYYMERNRYLAMFSYYRILTLILLLPAIVTMEIGMIFFSLINGWFGAKLRACFYYFKPSTWIKIYKQRKIVKNFRLKKDKDIIKNFEGRVLFQEIENPVLKYIANPILNIYWQAIKRIIVW